MAQHINSPAVRVPRAARYLCAGVCLAAAPRTGTGMRRPFRGRRRPLSNALLGSVRQRRGGCSGGHTVWEGLGAMGERREGCKNRMQYRNSCGGQ